ncbi:tRNA1Val (adenine37-N6)-methyltransferase [Larkinella arboricola]|uniref:tRNA1(Val) (adenine(37)-N6)-methyltransferase n=1 Tax=Larkinella arboricola TaxID=643671 RepID=A0A327WSQ4_LARAB|nr:methyltransferase [Larkinella arboricola]RAJ95668.1 tRNA1Val (adenine37-N6)-methyltransferase [Larkinella arboricola]
MFRFKQFTIQQDRTAMKVCTDSCLLGAYADVGVGGRLLDIGTGTGLLALMAAQRNPTARIDAVEVDKAAFEQATENAIASPFAERVEVVHTRIQLFSAEPYDRILSNPPFYTNYLRSPNSAVNRALHNDELPFDALITSVRRLLKPDGQFWVLLPPFEMERLVTLAQTAGLHPFRQLAIRHHDRKPVFRTITGFVLTGTPALQTEELSIFEPDGRTYTGSFRQLLQAFYLIF